MDRANPSDDAWRGTFAPPAVTRDSPPRPHGGWKAVKRNLPRVMLEPRSWAAWVSAWRHGVYLVAGLLLLAIPGFVFVVVVGTVGLGMSLSFAGMLAGLPLLILVLLGARRLGAVQRWLAGRLLGVRVEPPPPPRQRPGALGRSRAALADPVGWRACAYLLLKLPVALVTMLIASYVLLYGLPYLTFPIWWEILHVNGVVIDVPRWLSWWQPDPLAVAGKVHSLAVSFALVPAGVAVLVWAPWATKGGNTVDGRLTARLLGPPLGHPGA